MDKDTVNILILIAGLIISYIAMRRDNRKSNEESFEKVLADKLSHEKQITDLKECFKKDIEAVKEENAKNTSKLALLEQRADMKDTQAAKEISDLKKLIEASNKKTDELITSLQKKIDILIMNERE